LEVFAIGTDNYVYSDIRTGTGSGGWAGTSWRRVATYKNPSATMQAQSIVVDSSTGKEEVFVIGLDNAVHTIREAFYPIVSGSIFGTWSWGSWVSLGGSIGGGVKSIAVATTADGREEVFAIDKNTYVESIRQDAPDDWSTSYWDFPGGLEQAKSLTVARNADGREEIFAIAMNNNVVVLAQAAPNDGWTDSQWYSLGIQAKQVAVVMNRSWQWGLAGAAYDDLTVAAISSADNSLVTSQQTLPDGGWN
jgi:hypothetical protein